MTSEIAKYQDEAAGMISEFGVIDALIGGTAAMRAARETYLPKRPLEEASDYEARLRGSTLYPGFTETVKSMVGRVFARPAVTDDKTVPAWMRNEVLPDIDRGGRNLTVFAKAWWQNAFEYGLSHVIVDSPQMEGVRTKAEQSAAGVRPYATVVSARDVLGWRTDKNGKLIQLRARFWREDSDGEFGVAKVPQIRVYTLDGVTVYEEREKDWGIVERIALDIPRIPIVTLYTNRTGFMTARPPLLELAWLNAKHWRLQSGLDSLVDTAMVPILSISGVDGGDDVVIGAKHAVKLPTGAEMKYVEHTGQAIAAGRDQLLKLEDEMRQAGAKLVATRDVAKNQVQAGEEAARENSQLGGMVTEFEDTLADLLDLIAEWRGEKSGGKVALQPNLSADFAPAQSFDAVMGMRRDRIVSQQTVFNEAKRRGFIADDVEWVDEQERIASDPAGLTPPTVPPAAPPKNSPPAGA